tara:strand:- start:1894 stop:3141 length:1248 start_codon:yes stop_codon:yes gene_type:complete
MSLDFSAAEAALKDDYQPAIREQLNQSFMLLNQVETNTTDVEGNEAVISLHTGRNSGVGARAESGTLPTAGQQGYTVARIPVKFNYGRMQVTGPIIEAMKSDRGSFTRAIDSESKGIMTDLKRDVNRQCYTPNSGVIGKVVSVSSNTVTFGTEAEVRRLVVGNSYDFYDGDYASDDTGEVLASVDISAKTATFTGLSGVDAADWVVNTGVTMGGAAITNKATEDATQEIHGLEDIISDASSTAGTTDGQAAVVLHGINGSTTSIWKSHQTAASAAPTDSVFEEALNEIELDCGEEPDLIVTSHKAKRAYAATLKSQKRYQNTVDLKGGFKALTVQAGQSEVPMFAERDCLDDVAFLVNTGKVYQYVMSDWSFMDRDGSVLSRVSNTDAYEATLYKYHELGTDQRNAHGKITDLTV